MSIDHDHKDISGLHALNLHAVKSYLEASMVPDPARAAQFTAPTFLCRFTGGREFTSASGPTQFNAERYRWVKKRFVRFDVVPDGEHTIIYGIGYLYGAWKDGTAFDHNRYVDRFVVRDGLILETDVWNDSAEWLLDQSIARS